jgi:alkylation response protein AidB-like acyl-CoA dehydrogenase
MSVDLAPSADEQLIEHLTVRSPSRSASGVEPVIDVDDNDVTDFPALARMAFVFAADVAAKVTDLSLHYHGGYGFAEEGAIQLFYRRARGWPLVLGDPSTECLDLADTLFGAPAVAGRRSGKGG